MPLKFKNITCIVILFLALTTCWLSHQAPAFGENPDRQNLISFIDWMRKNSYAENIISKYAADYSNSSFHSLMAKELSKYPKTRIKKPLTIYYYDLIPTNPSMEKNPLDQEALKAYFKSSMGLKVDLVYNQIPVDYIKAFGEPKETTIANKDYAEINGLVANNYMIATMNKYYKELLNNKGEDIQSYQMIARLGVGKINGLPVTTTAHGGGVGATVATESPSLEDVSSFDIHKNEWLHCCGLSLQYNFLGTPLTSPTKIDPLYAYLIEPEDGFAFPEEITGTAYFQYLTKLPTEEMPYTRNPMPKISIEKTASEFPSFGSLLKIKIKNSGNIPLAYLKFHVEFPDLFSHRFNVAEKQTLEIDWLPVGKEFRKTILLPSDKGFFQSDIYLDPLLKNITVE